MNKLIEHTYSLPVVTLFRGLVKRSHVLIFMLFFLLLNSCIESYVANVEDEPDLLTIEASLIKGVKRQKVIVSRTVALDHSYRVMVGGCLVNIMDELGNTFPFEEVTAGAYYADVDDNLLKINRNYKLIVITPEGENYESEYEKLQAGTAIDSAYYIIEDRIESGIETDGLQFYVDLKATDSISRYYRWKVEETYEYTSAGPINYFYFDKNLIPVPPDDIWAVYRCWQTEDIDNIFITSTVNLVTNEKKRIPLNYVSTQTDRLKIKYSILLQQYSLNENAYNYFMQNKIATEGSEGLYTSQPQQPVTNFYNVNNESERVVGYFWVAELSKVRMIIPRIIELEVKDHFYPLEEFSLEDHGDGPFPLYIMEDKTTGIRITGSPYCFDCTRRGGTTSRPDFWN